MKEIFCTDIQSLKSGKALKPHSSERGIFLPNSAVIFEKMEGSLLKLTGKSKGKVKLMCITIKW